MNSFSTTLCIPTTVLPPDFVRLVNSRHTDCDPLGPTDTVDDVAIDVDYTPGWFKAGKYYGPPEDCYEDEGEDPEILSITLREEGYEPIDLLKLLPDKLIKILVTEAWEHQKGDQYEPDYDPEPYDGAY